MRAALLRGLLERCGELGRKFVSALLVGELRQGALESLVLDAVAQAANVDKALLRRAQMLRADLREVSELAFSAGTAGLAAVQLKLFQPVQPMLAEPVADVDAALATLQEPVFELKMDGARVQVHKQGDEVRVYSRALNEVSGSVPEVLELVRALPAGAAVGGAKHAPRRHRERDAAVARDVGDVRIELGRRRLRQRRDDPAARTLDADRVLDRVERD